MTLSRMDLDGNGAGSPEGLVALILKAEPTLPIPVPIERICRELDISEIRPLETNGYEGGLITDPERSEGIILVKRRHWFRQRFTIGHELGHFLTPTHMPDTPGRFLCSREDLRLLSQEGVAKPADEACLLQFLPTSGGQCILSSELQAEFPRAGGFMSYGPNLLLSV
jgi:hypothetical protein